MTTCAICGSDKNTNRYFFSLDAYRASGAPAWDFNSRTFLILCRESPACNARLAEIIDNLIIHDDAVCGLCGNPSPEYSAQLEIHEYRLPYVRTCGKCWEFLYAIREAVGGLHANSSHERYLAKNFWHRRGRNGYGK